MSAISRVYAGVKFYPLNFLMLASASYNEILQIPFPP